MSTSRVVMFGGVLALALSTTAHAQPQPPPPPTDVPAPPEPAKPVAPAPAPAPATAASYGWDTPYALLFSLNNVLQVDSVVSEFQGLGIAGMKHLSPTRAWRAGIRLQRATTPQAVTQTVVKMGADTITTYQVEPGQSTWDVLVAIDYLARFTEKKISPYVGAGVFAGYTRAARNLADDLSVTDQLHEIDERDIQILGGVRGVFGIGWRIHESFSLFAEYALTVPLIQRRDFSSTETITDTANDAAQQMTVSTKTNTFLNFDVGLIQGASFGLAVMF